MLFRIIPILFLSLNAFGWDHASPVWNGWLKKFATTSGPVTTVAYKKAKEELSSLQPFLDEVSKLSKAEFQGFTEPQKLAFLINAYNAFTVKLILDHYPVKSIKDIGSLFSSPWKKKFFTLFGEDMSLDGIEHGIIRKEFKEARIHFAVVCASKGCPQLRTEAYQPDLLDKQLEEQTVSFLKDSNRNRFDSKEDKLFISKIFDWYEKDFEKASKTVQTFVASRIALDPKDQEKIMKAKISYLDYDWSLNEGPLKQETQSLTIKP